ncbi:MAG: helix-turn-helix domain-containing protein [Frankiaceae bacterium]|nr:helix-turn-helix domain-containing protein [Frankiaceae bacterium]
MTSGDATAEPAAPTLSELLSGLRPGTITVFAGDTDVPVAEPVICDPTDISVARAGDIVLAVGATLASREMAGLIRRAAGTGVCAVVVATEEPPTQELIDVATEAGVALMTVPADVAWGRLYALLRTATSGRLSPDAGSGVPAGDLFRLADAIAAMVGGPVTIEDPRSVVLAYSTGDEYIDEPRRQAILGRRVADHWQQRYRESGIFRHLATSDDPIMLPGTDELRPRLVVGVRAAGEMLGSIWVSEADRPFDTAAHTALASAARLTALHLLRHRETEDLDRRRRADALTELLDRGQVDAGVLSLEPGQGLTVVAVEPQGVEGPDAVAVLQRLGDLVAVTCEAAIPGSASVATRSLVYALLPDGAGVRAQAVVPQLLERIKGSLHRPVLIGVGGRVTSISDVPRSRTEADLVLRALAEDEQDRRWAHIEELRAQTVLLRLKDLAAVDPHLVDGPLLTLVEHDTSKDSSYIDTLRAYLASFGDVTVAAASLNVHPNTFRYRLRRLVEISGIDLDDPQQRLVAELQLYFLS